MIVGPHWRTVWYESFYVSGTLTVTGDSGITASPGVINNGAARFPLAFHLVGENITTDETLALTVNWLDNDTAGILGTTTFDTLTASVLRDYEAWPGDASFFNAGRDMVPMFPYFKANWTLAGTTKSMNFTLYVDYLVYTV